MLVTTLLMTSQSSAQSVEEVSSFCAAITRSWSSTDKDYVPTFGGDSPQRRGLDSYWRHTFRGVSVPVPMTSDEWYFSFFDSRFTKGMAGLGNPQLNIRYNFAPSPIPFEVESIGEMVRQIGLPVSELSPMALAYLALTIDPDTTSCDSNSIQSTVDNFSAIYLKSSLLQFRDIVYLHEDGFLGHSVRETGESWTYVFKEQSSENIYQIELRHESVGQFQLVGFEIANSFLQDSTYSPPWMPLFFQTMSEPTKENFLGLREIIDDYSLPKYSHDSLDEKLSQFE